MFIVQYKYGSKHRRITLGAVGALDASKARATAKDLLAAVRLGRDPASEKQTAKAKADETFAAHLPRYLAVKRAELKPGSFREVDRHLSINCRALHARPIDAINQRAAAILLAKVSEERGPKSCNNTRSSGSGYYAWLMREGLANSNPFANTNEAPTNAPRDRTLSDAELREIWQACPDTQYGAIVKLLMLLSARREEIASLRWSEVDLEAALITLPPGRTKGGREHEIPLSGPALEILKVLPRRTNSDGTPRDLVFGTGRGGFQDFSGSKLDLDARISPMPGWTLHDFRRSFSTTAHERLAIQPHIVEECLGHATFKAGVAGVYNKAIYRADKRRAFEMWSSHLMAVIEGRDQKVISLRPGSA
jgi:integrase